MWKQILNHHLHYHLIQLLNFFVLCSVIVHRYLIAISIAKQNSAFKLGISNLLQVNKLWIQKSMTLSLPGSNRTRVRRLVHTKSSIKKQLSKILQIFRLFAKQITDGAKWKSSRPVWCLPCRIGQNWSIVKNKFIIRGK